MGPPQKQPSGRHTRDEVPHVRGPQLEGLPPGLHQPPGGEERRPLLDRRPRHHFPPPPPRPTPRPLPGGWGDSQLGPRAGQQAVPRVLLLLLLVHAVQLAGHRDPPQTSVGVGRTEHRGSACGTWEMEWRHITNSLHLRRRIPSGTSSPQRTAYPKDAGFSNPIL